MSERKIITKVVNQELFALSCVCSEEFGERNTSVADSVVCSNTEYSDKKWRQSTQFVIIEVMLLF